MIVIFDWDGTLCDSADHIVRAMKAAAFEIGIEEPEAAAVRNIIGLGLVDAVKTLFPDLPRDEWEPLALAYSRHYTAGDEDPPQLFPGALETLVELRERGFELGVATGKSRRGLARILSSMALLDFFDATRCADETRGKPDPLMLEEIMRERGKGPSDALMVGDTEYDLEMARRAGMDSVGVSFGVHEPGRLKRHRPLAIVDDLPQLLDLPALSAASRG
jgi:phosphoglycolate phosphatase